MCVYVYIYIYIYIYTYNISCPPGIVFRYATPSFTAKPRTHLPLGLDIPVTHSLTGAIPPEGGIGGAAHTRS